MKQYNIPVFIPHEGCPHDCLFCNQRKITGVQTTVTPTEAKEHIATQLAFLPPTQRHVEVAFFGGSFTGLPLSMQEEFYRIADGFRPQIDGIRLSTRPDYITEETLNLAKRWGVTMIELGAQSAEDGVLFQNNRGHTFSQTCVAVAKIRQAGIGVGLQMMTGMLGSSRAKDLDSARMFADLSPDCVRIYPVLVLKDTALAALYRQGKYQPQSLEEAVVLAKEVKDIFESKQIPVIRLGLHAGEDLQEDGTVLAGPFHPAFGELVESRAWLDRLISKIKPNTKELVAEVPANQVSKAIGHKRCNVIYLQENYGISLRVKQKEPEV